MAEGDTILRLARRFEQRLVGETIAASAPNARGKAAGIERLDGLRLERVEARGKHLLLDFGELSLHSHLGISGGWHLYRRGARWRRPRSSAWAVLSGGGWDAVQLGGPTLEVVAADRLRRDPRIARLGPDILAADFDEEAVAAAIRADPTRALGDALLDQHLVAGIGNIFKSEACFAARVDPWRPIGDLRRGAAPRPFRRPRPDAGRGEERPPPPQRLPPSPGRLPPLPRPYLLPRPGRRQPHHLLVPALPGVSYFLVAGVALDGEMERLRDLDVFADGPLAEAPPQLKVRRARRRPNRLGFAVPSEFRLSVTAYPGIRRGDVLETLLHELVHLHVGRAAEAHGWHGPTFKRTLALAMREAYGVRIPIPRATIHGRYAEAIEAQASISSFVQ